MKSLENQVVLVTGGARGLGKSICETLGREGAIVFGGDILDEEMEQVAAGVRTAGGRCSALGLDVSDVSQIRRAVDQVMEAEGRLDVLVNNAGTDVTVPLEELSVEDLDRILRVNLHGPFLASKFALPIMREQGGGYIVNIVSTAARRAWANASAYHASKWGLRGLSYALYVEGRPHNVKVTALLAGGMQTPFILERFPDTPLENLQKPQNVAEMIRYLLTMPDESIVPEIMVIPMQETSWP
jgi:NAD(P)-dependent dehydrogenase (short-subunit alcohol dehydrogenase family)